MGTLFSILDGVGGEEQWESGLEVADEVCAELDFAKKLYDINVTTT
jgi:hypothetical protein